MTLQPRCEDVETAEGVAITVTGVAQVRQHLNTFLNESDIRYYHKNFKCFETLSQSKEKRSLKSDLSVSVSAPGESHDGAGFVGCSL